MVRDGIVSFFNIDSGTVEFLTTDWLSQNAAVAPIRGLLPIILSLYRRPSIVSITVFIAQYSEPKVEVSTVF